MKKLCVILYGKTCAGKSTVGKYLSYTLNCPYISFGDLKRQGIVNSTEIGLAVKNKLKSGLPIPADLGYLFIKDFINNGLNIISGYPISIDEFNLISMNTSIVGIIVFNLDEKSVIERFKIRRECPLCHMPGTIGELCLIHKIPMVRREDANYKELSSRIRLYQERIVPFLELENIKKLPRLSLDSTLLSRNEVICQTEQWVKLLLNRKDLKNV